MSVPKNEMSGESLNALGSYTNDKWVSPLSGNLKRVGFYLQLLGMALTIIGAICVGSRENVASSLIRQLSGGIAASTMVPYAGQTIDPSITLAAGQTVVNVTAYWNWILAASVFVTFFCMVGFLEPLASSYTSMATGTGLFLAITGPLLEGAHTLLQTTTKFFQNGTATLPKTTGVEDTIIAGLLLCFIGAALAVYSFVSYRVSSASKAPGLQLALGIFVWCFEFCGTVVFLVYSQGRQPVENVPGVGRMNDVMVFGIIAFLQSFYYLFAVVNHSRTHHHAIVAFSGFFTWWIMLGALRLDQQTRDGVSTSAALQATGQTASQIASFHFDTGMAGWAMIFISQFLIVFCSFYTCPKQILRVYYRVVNGNEEIIENPDTRINPRFRYAAIGVCAFLSCIVITGIIISAAQNPGGSWNWRIGYSILPALLLTFGVALDRHVLTDAAAAMILAASGEWILAARQLWLYLDPMIKAGGTAIQTKEYYNAMGMATGAGIAVICLWLMPLALLLLWKRAFTIGKSSVASPFSWAKFALAFFLAIIAWIGAIVAWSVNLIKYGGVAPITVNTVVNGVTIATPLAGFNAAVNGSQFQTALFPLSGLFSITTEVFVLAFWFVFAYGGYHGPSCAAVQFFIGWELFEVLYGGIVIWKNIAFLCPAIDGYCPLAAGETPVAVAGTFQLLNKNQMFEQATLSAGFAVMFVALCLMWIFLTFLGPDNRPPSNPEPKPENVLRYTYDDYGSYDYDYRSRSSSRSGYAYSY